MPCMNHLLQKFNLPNENYFRTEQTATLKVDGGHIITGASPGKLRQLNGNGHLFIGKNQIREYNY